MKEFLLLVGACMILGLIFVACVGNNVGKALEKIDRDLRKIFKSNE